MNRKDNSFQSRKTHWNEFLKVIKPVSNDHGQSQVGENEVAWVQWNVVHFIHGSYIYISMTVVVTQVKRHHATQFPVCICEVSQGSFVEIERDTWSGKYHWGQEKISILGLQCKSIPWHDEPFHIRIVAPHHPLPSCVTQCKPDL